MHVECLVMQLFDIECSAAILCLHNFDVLAHICTVSGVRLMNWSWEIGVHQQS